MNKNTIKPDMTVKGYCIFFKKEIWKRCKKKATKVMGGKNFCDDCFSKLSEKGGSDGNV